MIPTSILGTMEKGVEGTRMAMLSTSLSLASIVLESPVKMKVITRPEMSGQKKTMTLLFTQIIGSAIRYKKYLLLGPKNLMGYLDAQTYWES
mgnify:CR=1 FL=1